MWAYESVFYQIYPFGFCGAPKYNDGKFVHRISMLSALCAIITQSLSVGSLWNQRMAIIT